MPEANPPDADQPGSGRRPMFADFDELQRMISKWNTQRDKISSDGEKISRAIRLLEPPANDAMSQMQARAARETLREMQNHNRAMLRRTQDFIEQLEQALADLRHREDDNVRDVNNIYRG